MVTCCILEIGLSERPTTEQPQTFIVFANQWYLQTFLIAKLKCNAQHNFTNGCRADTANVGGSMIYCITLDKILIGSFSNNQLILLTVR